MNLIDEQHVIGLQTRQQPRQVTGLVQDRTRCGPNGHAHLIRHNVGQGGLAQTWRAVQQHVIQGLPALLRSHHKHLKVVHRRALSCEVLKPRRPQDAIQVAIRRLFGLTTHVKIVVLLHHDQGSTFGHEKAPAEAEAFQ